MSRCQLQYILLTITTHAKFRDNYSLTVYTLRNQLKAESFRNQNTEVHAFYRLACFVIFAGRYCDRVCLLVIPLVRQHDDLADVALCEQFLLAL